MASKKPLLICVVGPTAIGKTSLAIKLAQEFSTEIISADSRQFYKEMSIGTAVPSPSELAAIPHHFIHNISISQPYSVGDFERECIQFLNQFFKKRNVAIMVGGSGLYIDAVIKGLDNFPEIASETRKKLNKELNQNGIKVLQTELQLADPVYFEKVDQQNPHRLIRALEVFRATGKPYSSFLNKEGTKREFETLFIGLTAERDAVYSRINQRVDQMVEAGLFEEAESLLPQKESNALQTVGYREAFDYFEGKISKEEAISEIKKNTRRYAKRQITWFKKNEAIHWFNFQTDESTIVNFIKEKNAL
ncbi:tRNA (adenosine(37)-N6)-dimethylallyltransferase MiaA [Aequorivita sp. SDUM287046]|uniref:tRNA dimethylallyltransferase n=1 Tax=Aequorivita aurantiaca TaxID=3053356 RepID=A0ABT8DIQ0_9FLAO|nr:tRNA (adenosine(37)-N6)-dimethylallyltransferase MiaA [Aequorivita aurantiaca]MDN3723874.1 tRNA (adenosine(37)-N6)-dimethylallyltransferase MiaA [Aequorivita aurantiaca]